jgi:hypothetical protein
MLQNSSRTNQILAILAASHGPAMHLKISPANKFQGIQHIAARIQMPDMSRACHGHVTSALVHQIRLSCAKKTNETSFDIIVVYCCIVLSSFRWFLLVSVDWSLPGQASTCESRCWREPTDRSSESSRTLRISSGCNKDQHDIWRFTRITPDILPILAICLVASKGF